MKNICIYGAGAVGGFIGAQLARAGFAVGVVDQGATLTALQQHGLRLHTDNETFTVAVNAVAEPEALGIQDLVIIAVKATAMGAIARRIAPLIGPQTMVMTAMNGVPWWFFNGFGGDFSGMSLESVDPQGTIAAAIPAGNVVGGVVHGSFALFEPGYVKHVFGNTLIIGEPDGTLSERIRSLEQLLTAAGLHIVVSRNIQQDIWFKLWGNMTMNPVSALTGATCDRILDDPLVNRFCLRVMEEAAQIGRVIGCPVEQNGEERNGVTRKLGAFKTSMLQDVEAGRAVELDALIGSVREIGQKIGMQTPNIDALLGLARLHASVRGLYR
ncbi:2-dehydropantoate 2-reductase [Geobacter sp. FeAm09]|uniref:2-dehydropantoate 2-reductase n=1 Tax=Geobacter sp. FeAm09 TaxID=2597769 RepID=UPI0011EBC834|nr:2-dehydropantoate 2-reductase [Geobacter sp. FeAm09]QEM67042.1 2-dehydropantoate 2-reductase [Geobacter sp. FeAm09]